MKFSILWALMIFATTLFAQSPQWINNANRKASFPDKEYITGFVAYENRDKELESMFMEKLKNYAQSSLIQGVQTTIESASVLSTREDNEEFSELFMLSSVSTSGMTISGLKFETYYNKKERKGYALAYAKRSEVLSSYQAKLKQLKSTIELKLDQAKKQKGNKSKSLEIIQRCYPEFRRVEEAQSIIYALQPQASPDVLMLKEFKYLKTTLESLKAEYENAVADNIDDAAGMLTYALKNQLSEDLSTIRIVNLSYQDTKMGSSFSRRFSKSLEQKLSADAGLKVVSNVLDASDNEVNNLLNGTYWEEGENLKLIVSLKNIKNNNTIASAETKLPISWLKTHAISYKPENFEQAYTTMKAFKTNEVGGGGLMAEIWTNKGDQNLIYTQGDIMKLYVRVNRESYIRVIYHLADGSRVLLVDNYYIGSDKVNKVYELPFEFECAEPFGVETLQLNAQTKPFEPLNTTSQYGYDFINDGLNEILVNTRGFKKVTNDVQKAEKRVVITTMNE